MTQNRWHACSQQSDTPSLCSPSKRPYAMQHRCLVSIKCSFAHLNAQASPIPQQNAPKRLPPIQKLMPNDINKPNIPSHTPQQLRARTPLRINPPPLIPQRKRLIAPRAKRQRRDLRRRNYLLAFEGAPCYWVDAVGGVGDEGAGGVGCEVGYKGGGGGVETGTEVSPGGCGDEEFDERLRTILLVDLCAATVQGDVATWKQRRSQSIPSATPTRRP